MGELLGGSEVFQVLVVHHCINSGGCAFQEMSPALEGFQISLSGVVTNSMPTIVKSEVSISTIIGRSRVQWQRTGAEVNAAFSIQKASHLVALKSQGVSFLQRLVKGVVSLV